VPGNQLLRNNFYKALPKAASSFVVARLFGDLLYFSIPIVYG